MQLSNIYISTNELGQLFLSILVLLIFSYSFGQLFNKYNLPRVVGEILGGIVLGPSCLRLISPEFYNNLFNFYPEQGKILAFLYWLGLILLMLSAGFKVNKEASFKDKKVILNLIISSTIFPILGGLVFYHLYDFSAYKGIASTDLSIAMIVCIAIAVTSIPVISKIFIDLNIINSQFAKIVLATATFKDLILWMALSVAVKTATEGDSNIILVAGYTLLFLIFSLLLGPYLANYFSALKNAWISKKFPIGYILGVCFLMIVITTLLGINIAFGALMAGIIIGRLPSQYFSAARTTISDFSLAFFVPLYFSIVGLKINLPAHFDLNLFVTFFCISSIIEIGSVLVGLHFLNKNWLTRLNFGVAMNTRGGPGIILATIAFESGIINEAFFVALILVSIMTSLISGAWFEFVLNKGWLLCEEK